MAPARSRRIALVLAAVGAVALSACDSAAESGIERLIESQAGGDVDLDLDGDGGFSIQTEEGGMSIDEDGNFVITDDSGEVVTGNASEDGGFSAESEDGSFRIDSSGEIPEEWPDDVPRPDGIDDLTSTVQQFDDELGIILGGQAGNSFLEDYASVLEAAGFEQTSSFESQDAASRVLENGTWTVSINSFSDGDAAQVGVNLFAASS
ncbi:MAG TPA: hypothetical protein VK853_11585 [Ilumatobacteraceae bacterium]|nr:hypothetical protein [Ilumatobacteraceae bacterium]